MNTEDALAAGFVRVDADSAKPEIRFDCCPDPLPEMYQDSDDKKAWEVMCSNCSMTLCYLTAPDESATVIEAGGEEGHDDGEG